MVWGNSYIYTATTSSQLSDEIQTDKIRIATTTAIAIAIGDANVSANTSNCMIIPENTVERSILVGQGNYVAYIDVGSGSATEFSITELGMPHAITGTE
jgi:hypothetical protein